MINKSIDPKTAEQAQSNTPTVRLTEMLLACTPYDGNFELRMSGVHALPVSRPDELVHAVPKPGVCIVAQGAKSTMIGRQVYEYDESRILIYSVEVPVAPQVTRASHAKPYVCLKIDIDPLRVADLVMRVYPHGLPRVETPRALYMAQIDENILRAAVRLMESMSDASDAKLLASLVIDEIMIRLLQSRVGPELAQLEMAESGMVRVARAIAWLHENFAHPMKVEKLAGMVNMSVSSFHHHFKSVTR